MGNSNDAWMIEVIVTPLEEGKNEPYFWCLKHCVQGGEWCMWQAGWAKTYSQAWRQASDYYKKVMARRGVKVGS